MDREKRWGYTHLVKSVNVLLFTSSPTIMDLVMGGTSQVTSSRALNIKKTREQKSEVIQFIMKIVTQHAFKKHHQNLFIC